MQSSKKTLNLFLVFFIILSVTQSHAQENYQQWLKKQQQAFQEYKDKRDQAFTEFLEREWREMQAFQGLKRDHQPKPVKMPEAKKTPPVDKLPVKDLKPPKTVKEIPVPKFVPPAAPNLKDKPEPVDIKAGESLEFNYYNAALSVDYDRSVKIPSSQKVTNKTISAFWSGLSRAKYESVLAQAKYFKEAMQLNDWGFALLLNGMARKLYPSSPNHQNLFVWFMLSKAGYETKIGYSNDQIYLLLPSDNVLYGVMYFNLDGKRFYLVSLDGKKRKISKLFTYDGGYPGADRPIDLSITRMPNIQYATAHKNLKFDYRGKTYNVEISYNQNVVDFFEFYPQTNLEVYFNAPTSQDASYSLLKALKPIIKGQSETDAANILLRFVQKAFDYKTDDQQFGREKFLFAEETLFYPYSDCEDRSILFAYLVHNLLGLEVIGLDYPGHIATAVKFSGDVNGDFVMHKGGKYVICDPTYINANLGMRLPQVKNATPKVIDLKVSEFSAMD